MSQSDPAKLTMVVTNSFAVRRGEFVRIVHQERPDEPAAAVLARVTRMHRSNILFNAGFGDGVTELELLPGASVTGEHLYAHLELVHEAGDEWPCWSRNASSHPSPLASGAAWSLFLADFSTHAVRQSRWPVQFRMAFPKIRSPGAKCDGQIRRAVRAGKPQAADSPEELRLTAAGSQR